MKTQAVVSRGGTVCAGIVAIALCLSAPCRAQSEGGPSLFYVGIDHVKPDMTQEWEDLLKNEMIPALKKAGAPKSLYTWQTAVFGSGYEYVTVAPIPSFAVFDNPHPAVKALGQESAMRLFGKFRKCVEGSEAHAMRFRGDLSIMKEMQGPPTLAVLSDMHIVPGKNQDFENLMKNEILPAWQKTNVAGFQVLQEIFGGDPNSWTVVVFVDKFANFDAGHPLLKVMGEEGMQKLSARMAGIVASSHLSIARYRADLSFQENQ